MRTAATADAHGIPTRSADSIARNDGTDDSGPLLPLRESVAAAPKGRTCSYSLAFIASYAAVLLTCMAVSVVTFIGVTRAAAAVFSTVFTVKPRARQRVGRHAAAPRPEEFTVDAGSQVSVLISDAPTRRMWTWPIERTMRSLLEFAPTATLATVTIVMDGPNATMPMRRGGRAASWDKHVLSADGPAMAYWGDKCGAQANTTAYAAYKLQVKALARDLLPSVQFVEPRMRMCLAGSLRLAMHVAVRTPYVLVMQSDMPLQKSLEAQLLPVLRLMAESRLDAVYLALGGNDCNAKLAPRICQSMRPWTPPRSPNYQRPRHDAAGPHLTPLRYWSDNNHIASTRFYTATVWPTYHVYELAEEAGTMQFTQVGKPLGEGGVGKGAGFMEWFLFCEPWKDHSQWRTYLLGDRSDGGWSTHLDGRLAIEQGVPTQKHVCEGGDGVNRWH